MTIDAASVRRGRRPFLVAMALAAVALAALAVVWLAPRTDVPTQFWFMPLDRVSVGDREIRVVRVDYGQGLRGYQRSADWMARCSSWTESHRRVLA